MIQVQRQDFNGRMLTIRRDDLRAIACILDVTARRAPVDRLDGPRRALHGLARPAAAARLIRRRRGTMDAVTAPDAFGVYLHVPFCARALRLLRVRHLDRPRTTSSTPTSPRAAPTPTGSSPTGMPAGHVGVRRRRHAVAGAGRRPGRACSAAIPRAAGAEVTVECNPDDRHRRAARHLPRRRREPPLVRRAVDGRPRARRPSAAPTTGPTSSGRSSSARAAGFTSFNLDLIYGGAGEIARRLAPHARRRARARPAPRVAPTPSPSRPGTPLAADPDRHPDDDDQADKYLARRPSGSAPPGSSGTRSRTGPGPATSAGTTSSTGRRATTRASAAPPTRTATAAGAGTCARPSATSTRSSGASPSRPPTSASTPTPAPLEALQLALRTRARRARRRRSTPTTLAGPRRAAPRATRPRRPHRRRPAARQRGRAAPAGQASSSNRWPG